jgi:hypothetical protein
MAARRRQKTAEREEREERDSVAVAAVAPVPPPPPPPPCRLRSLGFAELFGLSPRSVGRDLCEAVTAVLPAGLRRAYRVDALLSRGAYGIVFSAHPRAGGGEAGGAAVAVKVQFVCPKGVRSRSLCAAYGQRASGYDTVRYEALQHARVYAALEQLAADPVLASLPIPAAPRPILSQRTIVGRYGQFPEVPPDGRRRLWVSAMELIRAPTLRQTMLDARRRGTITYEAFVGVCGGVLKHLRVLHDAGYTHGDLHTGNVLVDEARVLRGERWVVLIDWERSIPREFVELAPGGEEGEHSAEGRAALWDIARKWDMKVYVESVVRLAESARIYAAGGGTSAASSGTEGPASAAASATPPRQRFRRAADLAATLLDNYFGRAGAGSQPAVLAASRQWVARALWLRGAGGGGDGSSEAALPTEVAEELGELRDVGRADRQQHRRFFSLLRAVQSFYTAPRRSKPPSRGAAAKGKRKQAKRKQAKRKR